MTILKGKKLVYSTKKDKRDFSSKTYVPCIPQIAKAIFWQELREAKKRVYVSGRWGYRYNPSSAYTRALSKFFKKKPIKYEIQESGWCKS